MKLHIIHDFGILSNIRWGSIKKNERLLRRLVPFFNTRGMKWKTFDPIKTDGL